MQSLRLHSRAFADLACWIMGDGGGSYPKTHCGAARRRKPLRVTLVSHSLSTNQVYERVRKHPAAACAAGGGSAPSPHPSPLLLLLQEPAGGAFFSRFSCGMLPRQSRTVHAAVFLITLLIHPLQCVTSHALRGSCTHTHTHTRAGNLPCFGSPCGR